MFEQCLNAVSLVIQAVAADWNSCTSKVLAISIQGLERSLQNGLLQCCLATVQQQVVNRLADTAALQPTASMSASLCHSQMPVVGSRCLVDLDACTHATKELKATKKLAESV